MTLIHNKIIAENFNALPLIIKHTEQCKARMQIAWLKLKLFDKAVTMALYVLTWKRKGEFNYNKTFDSFSSYITAVIKSFKLI